MPLKLHSMYKSLPAGDVEAGKHAAALAGFQNVVRMEESKSEWCAASRQCVLSTLAHMSQPPTLRARRSSTHSKAHALNSFAGCAQKAGMWLQGLQGVQADRQAAVPHGRVRRHAQQL